MNYLKPSFTVPASGKAPADCKHGWVAKNRCVLCGEVPKLESRADLHQTETQLKKEGLAVHSPYIPGKHGPHIPPPRPKGQQDFA